MFYILIAGSANMAQFSFPNWASANDAWQAIIADETTRYAQIGSIGGEIVDEYFGKHATMIADIMENEITAHTENCFKGAHRWYSYNGTPVKCRDCGATWPLTDM